MLNNEAARYTPEFELLLCCSRVHMTPKHSERIRYLLHDKLDWDYLLRIAIDHRVSSLLYKSLTSDLEKSTPAEILDQLHRTVRANAARNLFLTQQLTKILRLFQTHDIHGLCPEDTLIALCAQVAKDALLGRVRLHKVCDISETLHTHQRMDWDWVVRKAKRQGYQRIFFLGLSLAKDLLGTPLPNRVFERIVADSSVATLCECVRSRVFDETTIPTDPRWSKRFYFDLRERWTDKLYPYVTPTEKDKAVLPLPGSLSFLYYLIRAVRLPAKYVWQLYLRASSARR